MVAVRNLARQKRFHQNRCTSFRCTALEAGASCTGRARNQSARNLCRRRCAFRLGQTLCRCGGRGEHVDCRRTRSVEGETIMNTGSCPHIDTIVEVKLPEVLECEECV